jgi:hypothetical protein
MREIRSESKRCIKNHWAYVFEELEKQRIPVSKPDKCSHGARVAPTRGDGTDNDTRSNNNNNNINDYNDVDDESKNYSKWEAREDSEAEEEHDSHFEERVIIPNAYQRMLERLHTTGELHASYHDYKKLHRPLSGLGAHPEADQTEMDRMEQD